MKDIIALFFGLTKAAAHGKRENIIKSNYVEGTDALQ